MTRFGTPMQLLVASDSSRADLHIMGNITRGHWLFGKTESDTDATDIAKALADLPDTCREICVHLNSMGGEVAQGVAIYNALKAHKAHVTTVCEGFACSIASVIFMAGDDRVMRDASLLMIHEAWMSAGGNARDLRKAAEDLETITELSKRAYMERATDKLTREELDRMMSEETWILPEQAVEYGLATEVDKPDEDDDEPEQSAMRAAMARLSGPAPRTPVVQVAAPALDDEAVARIAAALAEAVGRAGSPPDPEPASFMQRAALLFAD
ncbi:MAG: Clp protease ClpP [Bacteroidales bacterium]|nr:Clp protease ClpP [Bacteroidales bacterium]